MLIEDLQSYCHTLNVRAQPLYYARNVLKEYLHIHILDYLYKHPNYKELIFYGGTCLRYCFDLPRLSEDLDFEYLQGNFDFTLLEHDLHEFFVKQLIYDKIVIQPQKFRLYLKFPILKDLAIAKAGESEYLNVKLEINSTSYASETYTTEIQPVFKHKQTFFIRRYDLPTLMASKLNALINRTWSRNDKVRGTFTDVKGRDFYDLLWYMARRVKPNIAFSTCASEEELWGKVQKRVKEVNPNSLYNNLVNFLEKPDEAKDWGLNFKESFNALYEANYKFYTARK